MVTVSELRDSYLSGHRGVARGAVLHQLIVRIINKSNLMYYGKMEQKSEVPYKVSEATHNEPAVSIPSTYEVGEGVSLSRRCWRCVTTQEVCVRCCGTASVWTGIAA